MGRPKVLPIRDNRQRALDYWIRFRQSEKVIQPNTSFVSKVVAELMADDSHDEIRAITGAAIVAGYRLTLAVDRISAGHASGWRDAMEAIAIGYLGSELMKHRRERTLGWYCRRSAGPDDFFYVAFHGVLAGLRLWPQADCLCQHLMNLWLGRGIDEGLIDQDDYLSFYWFVLRAQFKGEWPGIEEFDAGELGEFYPLFASRTLG